MSYSLAPIFKGADLVLGTHPVDATVVDDTGESTNGIYMGFVVNDVGSASPTSIIMYTIDGNYIEFNHLEAGAIYHCPNRGVHSVSAGANDIWLLKKNV